MSFEFRTLWELSKDGTLGQIADSVRSLVDFPIQEFNIGTFSEQEIIGIIGLTIVGMIFLPLGANKTSIKACQSNTNQKLVKVGGALIVVMTSISAIFFLEILELTEVIGAI